MPDAARNKIMPLRRRRDDLGQTRAEKRDNFLFFALTFLRRAKKKKNCLREDSILTNGALSEMTSRGRGIGFEI